MASEWKAWYRRPGGLGEVLTVLLPLVVSTSSYTIMQFTDRLFLLDYDADAMGAAMPAGMVAFAVLCFPLGLVAYVNTFVAQYFGSGQPREIGPVVWQANWIALAVTPLALATNFAAPWLFEQFAPSAKIAQLEVIYFRAMNWGAGAMLLSASLSSYFTGRGQTKVVMIVDSAASALNIGLDALWIYGYWGFPEAGIAGAAWATVVSLWAKTLVYLWLFLRAEARTEHATGHCRWNGPLAARLARYGAGSGLQFLVEISGFTIFLNLVGTIGARELVATNLAFNVNALAFMPVWGIGVATSTLVGQKLGENQADLAARATRTCFVLAAGYMLFFSAIYVLLPNELLALHEAAMGESSEADFAALKGMTVVLLRFVAIYCLFDAMYTVFGGAIKGAGDTRFVVVSTAIISGASVAATAAGLRWLNFGLFECWIVITVWIFTLGVTYWLRYLGGRWRTMRVIEREAPGSEEGGLTQEAEPARERCSVTG